MNSLLLPRGIRNNNPGNIRLSSAAWQGQKPVQSDVSFVEFIEPLMGLRALMRVLLNYHTKHGLNTVESIINRWAPPYENATDHYIHHVARRLNVKRTEPIQLSQKQVMSAFAAAIVVHENGRPPKNMPADWYLPETYAAAADLVLQQS